MLSGQPWEAGRTSAATLFYRCSEARDPSGLLFHCFCLFLITGVTYARARKQSNLKEKRRSTHGPSTHSCPGADQTGHLGEAPWPGAQSSPLQSPQLPVRVTAEQAQKDQAGGSQCSGPACGCCGSRPHSPCPGEGRTEMHGRGQAVGHQCRWSSGPPRDRQCAASSPHASCAALLAIQP